MIQSCVHHVIHHNTGHRPGDPHTLQSVYHGNHPIPNMARTILKPYNSFHTLTVRSSEHDTIYLPDDDITQWVTWSVWPIRLCTTLPVVCCHTCNGDMVNNVQTLATPTFSSFSLEQEMTFNESCENWACDAMPSCIGVLSNSACSADVLLLRQHNLN